MGSLLHGLALLGSPGQEVCCTEGKRFSQFLFCGCEHGLLGGQVCQPLHRDRPGRNQAIEVCQRNG